MILPTAYELYLMHNSFMCSLDISSLYTNIPVAVTIELILDNIFTNSISIYKSINRKNFQKILQLALNNTYLKFNGKIYEQKEGLAMGASLSPTVANIILNYFETNCLAECPDDF